MKYFEEDTKYKIKFHEIRNNLFVSQSVSDFAIIINQLLIMSERIDMQNIFHPMSNWQSVRLELIAMKYGLENWNAIKAYIINNEVVKQVNLIKELSLDKEKTSLFLYRFSQFGPISMIKIGNRNAYHYVADEVSGKSICENWTILWEEPYKQLNGIYTNKKQ